MVCDFCHEKEAVIFLEQTNRDGQRRKINICFACAIERGISPNGARSSAAFAKSIESSIGNLFKELADASKRIADKENKCCPVCGTSLFEIKKKGNTGCPECYSIFKNDIRHLLESNGINEVFKGSMPQRLLTVRSVLNDRAALQSKLNSALEREDYEKAAMYRDYLKALEKSAVSEGDEKTSGEIV